MSGSNDCVQNWRHTNRIIPAKTIKERCVQNITKCPFIIEQQLGGTGEEPPHPLRKNKAFYKSAIIWSIYNFNPSVIVRCFEEKLHSTLKIKQ